MRLPAELREALEARTAGTSRESLARAAEELSRRYRTGGAAGPVARSEADVAAYAAYRLPATYAAASAALRAVRELRPGWQPRSLLDLGAGPGGGAWAAAETWPSLERVTAVEAVPRMAGLGRELAARASHAAVRGARWLEADAAELGSFGPHDLVLLSYAAGELPASRLEDVLARAWAASRLALVVVEPGTPAGYRTVLDARTQLLAEGGATVAPCPHDAPCPLAGDDWCHFAVRLERRAEHRAAKRAALGFEDEKFSYAAIAKTPAARAEARILRHPQVRGGHVRLELCTAHGLRSAVVARSDGDLYRLARKSVWGAAFPWGAHAERDAGLARIPRRGILGDMTESTVYRVPGMSCAHCTSAVEAEVGGVAGVESVQADLDSKLVTVRGASLDDAAIRAAIDEAGYEAE